MQVSAISEALNLSMITAVVSYIIWLSMHFISRSTSAGPTLLLKRQPEASADINCS